MRVAVVGAGSWGTAMAAMLSAKVPTMLWARRPDLAAAIEADRRNPDYLPDLGLPPSLRATSSLAEALDGAEVVVMAVPSHGFRSVLVEGQAHIAPSVPVVSLTKGVEQGALRRMSEIVAELMPDQPCAVLTGPNLVDEIVAGHPTASVVATPDESLAAELQQLFTTRTFRVYTNPDVVGCELGGALKNVIAIAAGIADGMGFGDNTRGAVVTRGLAELARLGVALGGQPVTFSGLTGMGDLVATCTSRHSRNRWVGEQLSRGRTLADIVAGTRMVAEGIRTSAAVVDLAARVGVEMPLADQVVAVLHQGKAAADVVPLLMGRDAKPEFGPRECCAGASGRRHSPFTDSGAYHSGMTDALPLSAAASLEQALFEVKKVIVGQDRVIERMMVCLLARGHCLLEGVPGLAKTLAVETLAEVVGGTFVRLQFTPDLIPSDLVGTRIFRASTETFDVELGPVFANFVLTDEVNRAPAKVQSALLEVMSAQQVSIAGTTYPVPRPFLVLATQNPIESEGVYPLPEAQRDRFLMKILVEYPDRAEEIEIVQRMSVNPPHAQQVLGLDDLVRLQAASDAVFAHRAIVDYAVRLVQSTRAPAENGMPELASAIEYGASPRASLGLVAGARALSLLRGRDYVLPQDVVDVAHDVLRHRLVLSYEALADGLLVDDLISQVLATVSQPRLAPSQDGADMERSA